MSIHQIRHSSIADVIHVNRLREWFDNQQQRQTPVYYLFPTGKWLSAARSRQTGLAFMTFDDVATSILEAQGLTPTPLPPANQILWFYQLLYTLPDFATTTVQQRLRFARDCADTYSQWTRLGGSLESLPPDLDALKSLLEPIEKRLLAEQRFWHPETLLAAAALCLDSNIGRFTVVVDGFFDFTPLQYKLLQALVKNEIPVDIYLPYVGDTKMYRETLRHLQGIGFGLADTAPQKQEPHVVNETIVKATTVEEEIHAVLDDIAGKLTHVSAEEFGIVLADEHTYKDSLVRIAAKKGVPLRTARTEPLEQSRLIGALKAGMLDATERQAWDANAVMQSFLPVLFPASDELPEAVSGTVSATEGTLSIQGMLGRWLNLLETLQSKDSIPEVLIALEDGLRGMQLDAWWRQQIDTEDTVLARQIALEWRAYHRLLEVLHQQGLQRQYEADAAAIDLRVFLDWFLDIVRDEKLFIQRAPGRGVAVLSFRDAALFQGKHLYVLGMNDGVFPATVHLSGYIQPRHLQALTVPSGVPTAQVFQAKQDTLFQQLRYVAEDITYSYVAGPDEAHPELPSRYLDGLPGPVTVRTESELRRMERHIDRELVYEAELDRLEKLAYAHGLGRTVPLPRVLQGLLTRLDASACRTELVEDRLQNSFAKAFVTVSELQTYATCPFQYLMQRVFELDDRTPEDILDHRNIGNLVHQVIQEFYNRMGLIGEPFSTYAEKYTDEAAQAVLSAVFQDAWTSLEQEYPHVPQSLTRYDKQKWWNHLQRWWAAECKHYWNNPKVGDMRIYAFEHPVETRLSFPDGTVFQVRGRVDRVDVDDRGFVIYDYKTGDIGSLRNEIAQGTMLQLPIYISALERELGLRPYGATYVSLKDNPAKRSSNGMWVQDVRTRFGAKSTIEVSKPTGDAFLETFGLEMRLPELYRGMQSDFSVRPYGDACKYCHFKSVCRISKEVETDARA